MGRKVLLHLCALWSEGPPRQVGCVKLAALVHMSRAVRLRVCHVWDKKLALISHKKVANRIDAFVVLVVVGATSTSSMGNLGPQPWGPFFMHHAETELAP